MSSSSVTNHHAQWIDEHTCSCNKSNWRSFYIKHKVVPMSTEFAHEIVDSLRVIFAVGTLGISTVFNGGIKALEHDCVDVWFHCDDCGHCFPVTIDIGKKGVEFRVGRFQRYYKFRAQEKITVSYAQVVDVYESLRDRSYSMVNFNCEHFAYQCYHAIVRL